MVKKTEAVIATGMVLSACITIVSFFVIFASYEPLTVHSIHIESEVACPGDEVRVQVDRTLSEEEYDTINTVDVRSNWIADDVQGVTPGTRTLAADASLKVEDLTPGRATEPSRVLRVLPEQPGTWALETDFKVHGTRFWLPVLQEEKVMAEEEVEVLPGNSPECREGA